MWIFVLGLVFKYLLEKRLPINYKTTFFTEGVVNVLATSYKLK